VEAYKDGLKSQDDQGKLPLHLLVRQRNFDDGIFDLLVSSYPKAVLIKDRKGRKPKEMTNLGKNTADNNVVGDEDRNPEPTVQNTRDQKISFHHKNFTAKIQEYAKEGNAETAALVRLETEEFVHSLIELIDEANSKDSTRLEILEKELQESNQKYELYKTILQGNNAMLARCNQVIASMSETQDKTYGLLSDHRAESEAASASRISLMSDLMLTERRDQSKIVESVENMEKFIDSAKVKINEMQTVTNGPTSKLKPNIAREICSLDNESIATESSE